MSNPYIANVIKNVNMAMNYRPGVDERPDFNFKGVDQEYGNKVKKAVVDRTDPNL